MEFLGSHLSSTKWQGLEMGEGDGGVVEPGLAASDGQQQWAVMPSCGLGREVSG